MITDAACPEGGTPPGRERDADYCGLAMTPYSTTWGSWPPRAPSSPTNTVPLRTRAPVRVPISRTPTLGRPASGRVGFDVDDHDAALWGKLIQRPWTPADGFTKNFGGHFGNYQADFLRFYLLPFVQPIKS